jgi:hypothetical protein
LKCALSRAAACRFNGAYSSRGRSTWNLRPALKTKAPAHWYGWKELPAGESLPLESAYDEPVEIGAMARKKTWARLLAKIYDVDPARIAL